MEIRQPDQNVIIKSKEHNGSNETVQNDKQKIIGEKMSNVNAAYVKPTKQTLSIQTPQLSHQVHQATQSQQLLFEAPSKEQSNENKLTNQNAVIDHSKKFVFKFKLPEKNFPKGNEVADHQANKTTHHLPSNNKTIKQPAEKIAHINQPNQKTVQYSNLLIPLKSLFNYQLVYVPDSHLKQTPDGVTFKVFQPDEQTLILDQPKQDNQFQHPDETSSVVQYPVELSEPHQASKDEVQLVQNTKNATPSHPKASLSKSNHFTQSNSKPLPTQNKNDLRRMVKAKIWNPVKQSHQNETVTPSQQKTCNMHLSDNHQSRTSSKQSIANNEKQNIRSNILEVRKTLTHVNKSSVRNPCSGENTVLIKLPEKVGMTPTKLQKEETIQTVTQRKRTSLSFESEKNVKKKCKKNNSVSKWKTDSAEKPPPVGSLNPEFQLEIKIEPDDFLDVDIDSVLKPEEQSDMNNNRVEESLEKISKLKEQLDASLLLFISSIIYHFIK